MPKKSKKNAKAKEKEPTEEPNQPKAPKTNYDELIKSNLSDLKLSLGKN